MLLWAFLASFATAWNSRSNVSVVAMALARDSKDSSRSTLITRSVSSLTAQKIPSTLSVSPTSGLYEKV
ncbi:hypothetical protein D3C78_1620570 [compost metagenome]